MILFFLFFTQNLFLLLSVLALRFLVSLPPWSSPFHTIQFFLSLTSIKCYKESLILFCSKYLSLTESYEVIGISSFALQAHSVEESIPSIVTEPLNLFVNETQKKVRFSSCTSSGIKSDTLYRVTKHACCNKIISKYLIILVTLRISE